jgi:hypothetical protein
LVYLCENRGYVHGGIDAGGILGRACDDEVVAEEVVSAILIVDDTLCAGDFLGGGEIRDA